MCLDFNDLNKACFKDLYLLLSINKVIDDASRLRLLSFMDTYSENNQIRMIPSYETETTIMTNYNINIIMTSCHLV